MKETYSRMTEPFAVSLVVSMLPLFLVRTIVIKMFYSAFTFILVFLLLLVLTDTKVSFGLGLRSNSSSYYFFLLLLGFLGSAVVVFLPNPRMMIDPDLVWVTFLQQPSLIFRAISGYFLVSYFPGAAILPLLKGRYEFTYLERTAFILILGYCFTTVTGLLLLALNMFSLINFLAILWLMVFAASVHRYRTRTMNSTSDFSPAFDQNDLILLFVALAIVGMSYLYIFLTGPLTEWDTTQYVKEANQIGGNFDPYGRVTYVWTSGFFWIASRITGLPIYYAYSGLQFYQIIVPCSFYFLVRTLFVEKKTASVASLLMFFSGATSLLLFYHFAGSPHVWEDYLGNTTHALYEYLFKYTGSSGYTHLFLVASTFDEGFVLFALSLIYKQLDEPTIKLTGLLLPAFLVVAAFFSRSLGFLLVFIFTMGMFSLAEDVPKRAAGTIVILVLSLIFFIDPISKWCFAWHFFTYPLFFQDPAVASHFRSIIALLSVISPLYVALLYLRTKTSIFTRSSLFGDICRFFKRLFSSDGYLAVGILIFLFALYIYFLTYGQLLHYEMMSADQEKPWYVFVFVVYGLTTPLAIGSIPNLQGDYRRKPISFSLSFALSFLVSASLSLIYPWKFPTGIFYNRYQGTLLYPLSMLAALRLSKTKLSSSRKLYHISASLFLASVLCVPILSQSYSREAFYLLHRRPTVSPNVAEAIEWINGNIPRQSNILPLSESSEEVLSGLSNMRIFPIMSKFSPSEYSYSWLHDVLVTSSTESILYTLLKLNIGYIFAREHDLLELDREFPSNQLSGTLNSFPLAFENEEIKIFAVPGYPIYGESNYVLVRPILDSGEASDLTDAFNLLTAFGANFAMVNDLDLSQLKPNHVYFFPSNVHLPKALSQNLFTYLNEGTYVVFLNPNFAYLDELNHNTGLGFVDVHEETILDSASDWMIDEGYGDIAVRTGEKGERILHTKDGRPNSHGTFLYRLVFESPLDLSTQSNIEIQFSCNTPGWFYLALFDDSGKYVTWYGKYDDRYIVDKAYVDQWVDFLLPLLKPTSASETFDATNVKYISLGMDGLVQINQTIDFSVRKLRWSQSSNTPRNITLSPSMEALDFLQYLEGSRVILVGNEKTGNGSLTFVNSEILQYARGKREYTEILNRIVNILKNYLPSPSLSKEITRLPYDSDLFGYIIPHIFGSVFIDGLLNTLLFYDSPRVEGNMVVTSENLFLAHDNLSVRRIKLQHEDGAFVFDNETLNNLILSGSGKVSSTDSEMTISNNPTGSYSILVLEDFGQCNISISHANVEFSIEGQAFDLRNASVAITLLRQAESLTLRMREPTVGVEGSVNGVMQGAIMADGRLTRTEKRENLVIRGRFDLRVIYSSGVVYAKIADIANIDEIRRQ